MKFLALSFALIGTIYAQPIFKQDCNALPLGPYTLDLLLKDFNTTSATGFVRKGVGEDRVTVVTETPSSTGKALKVKYPKGAYDSDPSGAQWRTNLGGTFNELYMSYFVQFDANFELDKIGKLPGLGGGLKYEDREAGTEWSGKLMWRNFGAEFYLHSPLEQDKKFEWKATGATTQFKRNKWYLIELHYKMNTVGSKNGWMEAWLDGDLVGKYTDIAFRDNEKVGITLLFFSTFFGGNSVDAPNQHNYAYFDEFIVSETPIKSVSTKLKYTIQPKLGFYRPGLNRNLFAPENGISIHNLNGRAFSQMPTGFDNMGLVIRPR